MYLIEIEVFFKTFFFATIIKTLKVSHPFLSLFTKFDPFCSSLFVGQFFASHCRCPDHLCSCRNSQSISVAVAKLLLLQFLSSSTSFVDAVAAAVDVVAVFSIIIVVIVVIVAVVAVIIIVVVVVAAVNIIIVVVDVFIIVIVVVVVIFDALGLVIAVVVVDGHGRDPFPDLRTPGQRSGPAKDERDLLPVKLRALLNEPAPLGTCALNLKSRFFKSLISSCFTLT
jgi:hypothetical protein